MGTDDEPPRPEDSFAAPIYIVTKQAHHLVRSTNLHLMTKAAVIYCRISRDIEGDGLGVERQRSDCLELCERRGWAVADVLIDNDVSAYSGKARPGYDKALAALTDGRADVLVAWHPDRLHRSPRELEDFVALIETTGATVATVTAGDVDLSTPEGRLTARIVGAVARKESEDKSRRLRRKHAELASSGKVAGGGPRPFGFEPDRITHRPQEVLLISEAAARVLAGETLYGIMKDWNDRAVATSTGAPWSTTALKTMLTAPRIAGLRSHRGEVVGAAVWEPVLPRDEWEVLRAAIQSRSRTRTRAPRSYLLTGNLSWCGKCGSALDASPRSYGRAYGCTRRGGCGGVTVKADPVEELVVEAVFEAVDGAALAGLLEGNQGSPADHAEDSRQIEERLGELADLFAAGDITRREWMRAREALSARLEVAQDELAEALTPSPVAPFAGSADALRKAWPAMDLGQRRAIVASVIARVVVSPATKGGPAVDLDRVSIEWRV